MEEPWYKQGDVIARYLWTIFILVVILWSLWPTISNAIDDANAAQKITCVDKPIDFVTETVESPTLLESESYTEPGKNGVQNVCTNGEGEIKSTQTTTAPVRAIYYKGVKVEPPPVKYEPYYEEYVDEGGGAICNDGSRSYSTGRGTCSWHGGVSYYL